MESLLGSTLQKYLGPFLLDFNPKKNSKFKFSLGKGQSMTLRDLKVDPQVLSKLMPGIPLKITQGTIDYATVKVKVHSLKSEPVVVEVGTVFLEIQEPVEILPYEKEEDGKSTAESTVPNGASSNGSSRDVDGVETRQTPNGPLKKRQKKNYPAGAKIFHGIKWNIKEIKIQMVALGDPKMEYSDHNLAGPPQVNISLRDLDLWSVDDRGEECPNLKKSRGFSKFYHDEIFVFKKGSCSLSISLTPANPWFPDVTVLEDAPLTLDITSISEPIWTNQKGQEVSVEKALEVVISSTAPICCHLDGEELLHVGECLKGLSSCFSRLDIPMNPTKYGRELDGPRIGIRVNVPEVVVSALLHGPAPPWGEGRKGLALRIADLVVGFQMGPEDYALSRTLVEVGSLRLFDLADPSRCYVEAPSRELGQAITGSDNIELEFWSCHPHKIAQEAQRHAEAVKDRHRKFLRLLWDGKNPWFSDYRPPESVVEQELFVCVDGLTVTMDEGIVDYALCIQTLVTMGLALESVPAPQESPRLSLELPHETENQPEEIGTPSILIVRSRLTVLICRPLISVKIPTMAGADSHISLFFEGVGLTMQGTNCDGPDDVINDIGWRFWCEEGGLFCDDPQFAVHAPEATTACRSLGPGTYALVFLPGVEAEGNILVEPEQDEKGKDITRGNICEVTAMIDGKEVHVCIHSQHLQQLLWGLATRYEHALMTFQSSTHPPAGSRHNSTAAAAAIKPRHVRHASDVKSQPVISVEVTVAQVSLLVSGGARGADKEAVDDDSAWMKLLVNGDSSFQIVGGLLSRLSVRVPSLTLLSRGTHMIWKEKGVETLVSVIWEKQDLDALQRRLLLPSLVGWKQAVVLLKGLRVQVNQGLVTDLDKFVRDLSGVKEVGADIGMIVHQVFSVVKMDSEKGLDKKKGKKKDASSLNKLKKAVTTRPGAAVPNLKRDRNLQNASLHAHGTRNSSGSGHHLTSVVDGGHAGHAGHEFSPRAEEDPTSIAGLEALAMSVISALPAEVDLQGQDCRVEIESSYESDGGASTVSFNNLRLRRGKEGDVSGDETDKEEWDGMVLQLKGLQLMDKRDMQDAASLSRRSLPSSVALSDDESEEEDDGGGEEEEGGARRRKSKQLARKRRPEFPQPEGEDLALSTTSRLQPFGLTCVMEWRTKGDFRPHFRVSGDKIHMVLQAPILMTIMGVFYELDTLKTSKRETKRIEAAAATSNSDAAAYSRRTSGVRRESMELVRDSREYARSTSLRRDSIDHAPAPAQLALNGQLLPPSPRLSRSPAGGAQPTGAAPLHLHAAAAVHSPAAHRPGTSFRAAAAAAVPPLYNRDVERATRLGSSGRPSAEIQRGGGEEPPATPGPDGRGGGDYLYKRQASKVRRDQEETKRLVKRQEQHYINLRSLLDAAAELVQQSPHMAAQILDDLLVEAQQGQEDILSLSRHVHSIAIPVAPGDNSL